MEIFDKRFRKSRMDVYEMSNRECGEEWYCVVGISIGHGVIVCGHLVDVSVRQVCKMTCVLCGFL